MGMGITWDMTFSFYPLFLIGCPRGNGDWLSPEKKFSLLPVAFETDVWSPGGDTRFTAQHSASFSFFLKKKRLEMTYQRLFPICHYPWWKLSIPKLIHLDSPLFVTSSLLTLLDQIVDKITRTTLWRQSCNNLGCMHLEVCWWQGCLSHQWPLRVLGRPLLFSWSPTHERKKPWDLWPCSKIEWCMRRDPPNFFNYFFINYKAAIPEF